MKDLSIFFKHDDVARIIEHIKSVLEASVDYCYPNHPEVEFEPRRGMTFEQALERLKLGRKIKRIDWGKKYICMFDVNILMIDTGQKVASNWNPTEHDIMSNDWEIAE